MASGYHPGQCDSRLLGAIVPGVLSVEVSPTPPTCHNTLCLPGPSMGSTMLQHLLCFAAPGCKLQPAVWPHRSKEARRHSDVGLPLG